MTNPKRIDLTQEELDALLERVESDALEPGDHEVIRAMAETIAFPSQAVDQKGTSIKRLLRMIFGASTETTKNVLRTLETVRPEVTSPSSDTVDADPEEDSPKGHGRNSAAAYTGADTTEISHESLKPGDACPKCTDGRVYELSTPGVIVRVRGQAPLHAQVYKLQKLRCNLCGVTFTAKAPEGVGTKKYDVRSAAMIALLKYGSGLPFNRLAKLQSSLGVPLPASTQWEIAEGGARPRVPAYGELVRQAAQGKVVHNDDTGMKILAYMEGGKNTPYEDNQKRTGVFTSGILSTLEGRKIALFFTGRKHAGENLAFVLEKRAAGIERPIHMSDGLSCNTPGDFDVIVANCLLHGRRNFVDVAMSFPDECLHILTVLRAVYKNDAVTRKDELGPEERLEFHKKESAELMDGLHKWMQKQLDEKKVEPNSGLGEAIGYMEKRWDQLTLFLREPNAPLDNNAVERALKRAILHRKNSLFYKTQNGARVGDLFMSLIQTCELNGADPFDYLVALQENAAEVAALPSAWMPWNYSRQRNSSRALKTENASS